MTSATLLWTPAYRPPENLPQTALQALFTITGKVRIWYLIARVTTVFGASASQLKFVFDPTSGAADVDLCAAGALSGLAAGLWFYAGGGWVTATAIRQSDGAGSAQTVTAGFVPVNPSGPIVCPAGNLSLNTTGNQTGQAEYCVGWSAVTDGAMLVVA